MSVNRPRNLVWDQEVESSNLSAPIDGFVRRKRVLWVWFKGRRSGRKTARRYPGATAGTISTAGSSASRPRLPAAGRPRPQAPSRPLGGRSPVARVARPLALPAGPEAPPMPARGGSFGLGA